MRNQQLYDQATALADSGISVIPCDRNKRPNAAVLPQRRNEDGSLVLDERSGRPKRSWDEYQRRIANRDEIKEWCSDPATEGIALVGGAVSGGLLIIDFDRIREDNPLRLYHSWWKETGSNITQRLAWQKTGSGGRQAFLRCPDPGRNDKLAWVKDDQERLGRKIAMETRAEAGYACGPFSHHPSGGVYELLHGDLTKLPIWGQEEAEHLLDIARCLDEAPMEQKEIVRAISRQKTDRPIENDIIGMFRQNTSLEEMLKEYGYMPVGSRYLRPGATSASTPGVTILSDTLAYFHSSNDPMNGFRGVNYHDAFDLFMYYEHDGELLSALEAAGRMYDIWRDVHTQKRIEGQPFVNKRSSFCRDANIPVINTSARRSAFIPVSSNRRVNIATGEIF